MNLENCGSSSDEQKLYEESSVKQICLAVQISSSDPVKLITI